MEGNCSVRAFRAYDLGQLKIGFLEERLTSLGGSIFSLNDFF